MGRRPTLDPPIDLGWDGTDFNPPALLKPQSQCSLASIPGYAGGKLTH